MRKRFTKDVVLLSCTSLILPAMYLDIKRIFGFISPLLSTGGNDILYPINRNYILLSPEVGLVPGYMPE